MPPSHCMLIISSKMAISSSAKRFVASPIVQSVVNDIYSGRVIYSSSANRSIVADNYKLRAIEIYNSRNAPWLNHYRYIPLLPTHPHNRIRICSYQFACAALRGNPRVPEFRFFVGHIHSVPLLHVSSFSPFQRFSLMLSQTKTSTRLTPSNFCSSFLQRLLLWRNTPPP